MKVAIQGYEGSYHDIVRNEMYPDSELSGYDTFHEVIEAVRLGESALGIIAVENSTYGDTMGMLELRTNFEDLHITNEYILRIKHRLYGKNGVSINEIRSHVAAIGQCRKNIHSRYPEAVSVEVSDTAVAASQVANLHENGIFNIGAIASPVIKKLYPQLDIIDENMSDELENETRFLCISRIENSNSLDQTDADKTSVRITIADTERSLFKVMQTLDDLGINYRSLVANAFRTDSRKKVVVMMDFLHAWHDSRLTKAVNEIENNGSHVHNLGTYKRGIIKEV